MSFRLKRGVPRRLASLDGLTIDVHVDFDMDAVKTVSVAEEPPADAEGYARLSVDRTDVYIRAETFTGMRLTRLGLPSHVTLFVDDGRLAAEAEFLRRR